MTTAEALDGITDESAFELLAVRALRELEPECHSLVHLGMNSQGKTIRSPLDGFCPVPNSVPPLYMMMAATTTSFKSLKSKWLKKDSPPKPKPVPSTKAKPARSTKKTSKEKQRKSDPGDVPKAILEALHVRTTVPSAKFVLYLATNRAITKELILETEAAGKAGGMEVRFLEQSRLRDFLDVSPIGHWLRWKHLGIDSDLISLPLLQELSATNISQYARDIALFEHQFLVETESEKRIGEQLLNTKFRLHLLVGDSGVGKSTAGLRLLNRHYASGNPGLWISAEVLDRASSFNSALEMALKAQMPSLRAGTGRYIWPDDAKRLVAKALRVQDKKPHATLLHSQLEQLTGFSSAACWRFLQRHGIQRPGSGTRKMWDPTIVDFVMEHGYERAAQKFGCSKKALYSAMERQQRAVGHCSGQYGLNQLRQLLNVRAETLKHWISAGHLEATPETYGGKPTFVVSDEQLRRFLSREAGNMLPRRFPEKRVEFLSNYLYDGKPMNLGLLRTRESKKEGEAYRNGEFVQTSQPQETSMKPCHAATEPVSKSLMDGCASGYRRAG